MAKNKTTETYTWLKNYPPKPDWHMEIIPRSMVEVLESTAAAKPNAQAFDFMGNGTTHTWSELLALVNKFAKGLQGLGVKKGDKIGIFLPNCVYVPIAYYGALKIGATVVNYNPLYAEAELRHQIEDSDTDIFVTLDLKLMTDKAVKMLSDTRLKKIIICPFIDVLPFPKNYLFPIFKGKDRSKLAFTKRILSYDEIVKNDGNPDAVSLDLTEDVAVLQYTGGTTGVPKGAMLTHANIHANAVQAYSNFPEPEGHEKMLAVLPFFHVFAMTVCMNMAVLAEMEIVTIPRFDLKQSLKLIEKTKPQYMAGVPAIYNAINTCPKLKNFDLSSLTYCISGGAPLPVEVKKKFEAKTGCKVFEGYGLTESSPVATVNPPFGENIAGSIGLPIPQTIIEIIDRDDKVTPIELGERGEVCISGPQVMKGYYKRPEETAEVLRPKPGGGVRLHTGDVAYMDENGYTYIVDRIKDLIITNGYNVYPRHVEDAIYQHPSVEECIVAGIPDKQRGEIVKAWIKLRDGRELSVEDIKEFMKDKISVIEMPKRFEFRDEPLPKTMIGKLSRKDIVEEELGKKG